MNDPRILIGTVADNRQPDFKNIDYVVIYTFKGERMIDGCKDLMDFEKFIKTEDPKAQILGTFIQLNV